MKVAIIGSRNLNFTDFSRYIPDEVTEIVSGGALGIDRCAANYAHLNNIPLTEFKPDYQKYGKRAPLIRNIDIINYADIVIAFWDGESRGTKFVIDNCKKLGKKIIVYKLVK